MLYFVITVFTLIFISLFFLQANIGLILLCILFLINILFLRSIIKPLKRALHILPYFLAVLVLQSITYRGEYYTVFGFPLDKTGVVFSVEYFIKILSILYFLSIAFIILKKLALPKNNFFTELIRVNIFMRSIKKSFFKEFDKIKNREVKFKEKLVLVKKIVGNTYESSFRYYPYNRHIEKHRYLESMIKTNSRFFTSL